MRAHNSFHYCFDILFIECEQAPTLLISEPLLVPLFFTCTSPGSANVLCKLLTGLFHFKALVSE